jgi:hypothetical protein
MNERIKELAEEAGLLPMWVCVNESNGSQMIKPVDQQIIERFAELVRQDERKACADLVFEMAQLPKHENNWLPLHHAQSAIRERQDT